SAETPEGLLKNAQKLERDGKVSKAVTQYKLFIESYPDHSQFLDARYRLAKNLDNLGFVDEVIPHLEAVVKSDKKKYKHRIDAYYLLGKTQAAQKEYAKAAAVYEKMLGEGAGLYTDEVLSLCGGYYAILEKVDEAAAKFNILKRKRDSKLAEQASNKLAMLWLRAEKPTMAISAINDLILEYPRNKQARGLMLQLANLFRKQRKFDKAVAVCEQLRSKFKGSKEADGITYILGLCYKDSRKFDKAIQAFLDAARLKGNLKNGMAAESILQAAMLYEEILTRPDDAMLQYEEAAKLARESNSDRKTKILEQCYFRLGEYNYKREKWAVALEFYLRLKALNTSVNVLPRIIKCQAKLERNPEPGTLNNADIALIEKKIKENPGTLEAAEAEVFLADRKLQKALPSRRDRKGGVTGIPEIYEGILKTYKKEILAQLHLESYIYFQLGVCYGQGETREELKKSIQCYEKALQVDKETPYKIQTLENLAHVAEEAGDMKKSFATYKELFKLTESRVQENPADAEAQTHMSEYLRSMITRAEDKDAIDIAVGVAHSLAKKSGPFSKAAREAKFYLGELYYLKQQWSAAAKTFREFIGIYGPELDEQWNVIEPWKPRMNEQVAQVYESAVRIAHAWYMNGHRKNMVAAYKWMVQNFPHQNKHLAEAHYWLAMEHLKGAAGKTRAAKLKAAEALWTNVANPSFDFTSRQFRSGYHYWVKDEDAQKFVRPAIMKSGELFSEAGEHGRAAAVFNQYLVTFPPSRRTRHMVKFKADELYPIARYAAGREYIKLNNIGRLIDTYKVYVDGLRDDRFRVSALQLLGFHAMQEREYEPATEAYAALLDEYGYNEKDEETGKPIPVPKNQRMLQRSHWNGIRIAPPKGLDLGKVRYSLGFLYWKQEDYVRCASTLRPFAEDPNLFDNESRAQALYMAGQSYFARYDYENGLALLKKILEDHEDFEAIEEVYVKTVRGYKETGEWKAIPPLHKTFMIKHPESFSRDHMELYAAAATVNLGQTAKGVQLLEGILASETYEDVKAEAAYHLGLRYMNVEPKDYKRAQQYLIKSVGIYPTELTCLTAGKSSIYVRDLGNAKTYIERAARQFPTGNRKIVAEAKKLLPGVLKDLAKQAEKKN
ncbi:MAG: tetratricopeptide repeat protein, partial [Planctomycetota bacterium]|nr:tetratricopeptide repeat protein [Planctomycetota bacterium]